MNSGVNLTAPLHLVPGLMSGAAPVLLLGIDRDYFTFYDVRIRTQL
jgi:hypothetical protein